ncbi:wax ester/triacylglycerol synthase family O-acyltransferase [Nocardioides sp. TRM66260-LWL]|uniref:wax ester/triacylglycerol synthase family O-acyltransferase n=1 Tax=Nocardioides sp. TRM66260-LWL TaxID=2874478 RepID=UPI001CC413B9|nr:wax ester/triacylglycerol synthase family O-acyltransferase [Nocardioides sp. TRM66260-LWL]MBZ5733495.1 wax ester/triacylglycerol synthase family O-acyltransferase [Nocardioides sp. TRM66260-LWL]
MHPAEGLADGIAMSATMHHALVDGYTAMKLLQRRLSTSRDDLKSRPLLAVGPRSRRTKERAPMARLRVRGRGARRPAGRGVGGQVGALTLRCGLPLRGSCSGPSRRCPPGQLLLTRSR